MKKNVNWLVFLLTVVALVMVPALAGAQAVVIRDTSCTVLDPSKNPFDVFDTIKVITPSRNDNKNVSCHGELPPISEFPEKAVVFDYENTGGLRCCVNFSLDPSNPDWVSTSKWHETITPSGNVSLTCHFKGGEPLEACMSPIGPH